MKKIMFNDRYGLTQAVLEGKKTMTRRRIHFPGIDDEDVSKPVMGIDEKGRVYFTFDARTEDVDIYPKYQIGERVAVAQSYRTVYENYCNDDKNPIYDAYKKTHVSKTNGAGFFNKLFVRADLMPHVIKITNIKAERLQDISDDDCLKEGIHVHNPEPGNPNFIGYAYDATPGTNVKRWWFHTPREAFAALINRVSGPQTWESNPWVIAYTFELVD